MVSIANTAMRIAARNRQSVESLLVQIDHLTLERQELRAHHAEERVLESNRLEIVQAQWELSRALIARHLQSPERSAA